MALNLKPDEEAWLDEYRQALNRQYPGLVEDMIIFHAEDAKSYLPDYTVNTVVILKKGSRNTLKEIDFLGYYLSAVSDAIPIIWVYDQAEWKRRQQSSLLPYQGPGISVWST